MMKINIEDIYDALLEFCVQQTHGAVAVGRINRIVDSAIEAVSMGPRKYLVSHEIISYAVYQHGKPVEDLLYDEAYDNSVICKNGVFLGTFTINDGSYIRSKALTFECGYDVVYDADNDEIILLYVVAAEAADGTITGYSVRTETFEDFELGGFVVSLAAQICKNLI